ncbi:MAG TPA: hypothetical protein EYG94_05900 [Campylobacterales bacterium]|nr:hypothetical protein [Campylobacterales bacterium]
MKNIIAIVIIILTIIFFAIYIFMPSFHQIQIAIKLDDAKSYGDFLVKNGYRGRDCYVLSDVKVGNENYSSCMKDNGKIVKSVYYYKYGSAMITYICELEHTRGKLTVSRTMGFHPDEVDECSSSFVRKD